MFHKRNAKHELQLPDRTLKATRVTNLRKKVTRGILMACSIRYMFPEFVTLVT